MSLTGSPFLVSVITPVYNAGPYVRRAVESAVGLPEVGEVILVDDAGPDNALEICQALEREHPKVRLLRHPDHGNHGAGASRNLGIAHARFDFIAFLDADDYYLPHRFHRDREILTSDPSIDGVYNACGTDYENEDARRRYLEQGHPELMTVSGPVPPEELFVLLFGRHRQYRGEFNTDSITVRSAFFHRVGLFDEQLTLRQDIHMWKRMAAVGRLATGCIDRAAAMRTIHDKNRMLDTDAQARCEEYWWNDLRQWFRSHRIRPDWMAIFEESYCGWMIETRPSREARREFGRYVLRHPSVILKPYGFFDLGVLKLFGNSRIAQRVLSAKNRLLRAVRS